MSSDTRHADGLTLGQGLTLTLRAMMEAGVVGALAFWGAHTGSSGSTSVLIAIAAPAVGFGVWGSLDFRFAGRYAEALRLLEELAISGVAAAALYVAGQHGLGITLAALSAAYHALVYLTGERLLKDRPPPEPELNRFRLVPSRHFAGKARRAHAFLSRCRVGAVSPRSGRGSSRRATSDA